MPAPEPPFPDAPLPFTKLERNADGCLVVLLAVLVVAVPLIRVLAQGVPERLGVLAGAVALGVAVGLPAGRKLGRGYVGGMFLGWPLRCFTLSVLLASLAAGVYLAASSRPAPSGPTPPAPLAKKG